MPPALDCLSGQSKTLPLNCQVSVNSSLVCQVTVSHLHPVRPQSVNSSLACEVTACSHITRLPNQCQQPHCSIVRTVSGLGTDRSGPFWWPYHWIVGSLWENCSVTTTDSLSHSPVRKQDPLSNHIAGLSVQSVALALINQVTVVDLTTGLSGHCGRNALPLPQTRWLPPLSGSRTHFGCRHKFSLNCQIIVGVTTLSLKSLSKHSHVTRNYTLFTQKQFSGHTNSATLNKTEQTKMMMT